MHFLQTEKDPVPSILQESNSYSSSVRPLHRDIRSNVPVPDDDWGKFSFPVPPAPDADDEDDIISDSSKIGATKLNPLNNSYADADAGTPGESVCISMHDMS